MLASTTALLGPIALMAIVGLNLVLLWRRSPALALALRGPQPRLVSLSTGGTGESNVIAFPARRAVATNLRMAA